MRVLPVFANGTIAPRIDRRYLNPSGQWVIECGDVGNVFASPVQTDPTLPPVLASDWNAMYWCRSANVLEPFVIAGRTVVDGSGSLTGEARLFATRTPGAPLPDSYWTLRFNPEHVVSAREPSDKLRELAGPSKLSVAATPQGYAVSFLHRSRLQFGWLDRDLHVVGALTQLPTLGATPGRATMRWNGSELVMVFADRAVSSDRYALRAARVAYGQAPQSSSFFSLASSSDMTQHEFAPELTRLDDGTFLLTWTHGAENARSGVQNIFARRYATDLSPRGGPLFVLGSASDSEVIAVNGNRAVLVALSGTSGVRAVQALALHCDP